jgi:DNA adenine methylase
VTISLGNGRSRTADGNSVTAKWTGGVTPPLKWHGGKHYLARKIIGLMPPHTHYVEPFFGGGAVLLAKDPEGVSEVVNDIHCDLTNFWRVLQDESAFGAFLRRVEAIPFSQVEWEHSRECPADDVARGLAFFVRCRQSLAGRMNGFAPLSRTRTRRGMNEQASAWIAAVDGLPEVHARLRRVAILCGDALQIIRQQDGPDTLFYCDPPYLHETRSAPDAYHHEMTTDQHRELLDVLKSCRGKIVLSGYDNGLYARELATWKRHDFQLPNNAAGGVKKRRMTECVWTSF